jgi:polyphosphate kinase
MPSIFAFTSIGSKKIDIEEEYPKDLVQQVQLTVHRQLEEFGSILKSQILPELKENHIFLYYNDPIREEHKETIRDYFLSRVLSFLQPVILHKDNQETVFLDNNALYFVVDMEAIADPRHAYLRRIEYSFCQPAAICRVAENRGRRFYFIPG